MLYLDGRYKFVTDDFALNTFHPSVLFYRILDEKREYFTYNGFAVPERPKTPKKDELDDWSDVKPLSKTVPYNEVTDKKQKMIEKLEHLEN